MTIRLIHLTDPHLTALDRPGKTTGIGKRALGALSWWRKRRHQHRPERLALTVAAIAAERPDAILVGGDLCQIGRAAEIAAAQDWLEALSEHAPVLLVPGNHDIYQRDSIAPVLTAWRPWLGLHPTSADDDPLAPYPVEWRMPGVTVIGLNSAVPTAIGSARGRLGAGQITRLDRMLAAADRRADRVCVLIHHPPAPGLCHWRKALADAGRLTAVLLRHRVDFVLHGHLHDNRAAIVSGLRVFGTASASGCLPAEPASYRVFDLAVAPELPITMRLRQHRAEYGFVTLAEEHWLAAGSD